MKDFSHFHQTCVWRRTKSTRLRNYECTLFPSPNTVGRIHNSSKQNLSCHIAAATALKKKGAYSPLIPWKSSVSGCVLRDYQASSEVFSLLKLASLVSANTGETFPSRSKRKDVSEGRGWTLSHWATPWGDQSVMETQWKPKKHVRRESSRNAPWSGAH